MIVLLWTLEFLRAFSYPLLLQQTALQACFRFFRHIGKHEAGERVRFSAAGGFLFSFSRLWAANAQALKREPSFGQNR